MLTALQVKKHSEVMVGTNMIGEDYTRCIARILYLHNNHLSKMKIICKLPQPVLSCEIEKLTEEEAKEYIDWGRFARWLNMNDDLFEAHLVTSKAYIYLATAFRRSRRRGLKLKYGRNGILNTLQNN